VTSNETPSTADDLSFIRNNGAAYMTFLGQCMGGLAANPFLFDRFETVDQMVLAANEMAVVATKKFADQLMAAMRS
jgi:glucosamine 6-phosphate synthetase-like amidotransferase/phosphosugar isomerase protein